MQYDLSGKIMIIDTTRSGCHIGIVKDGVLGIIFRDRTFAEAHTIQMCEGILKDKVFIDGGYVTKEIIDAVGRFGWNSVKFKTGDDNFIDRLLYNAKPVEPKKHFAYRNPSMDGFRERANAAFECQLRAVELLDIISAEFKSDPKSTQCFDARIVAESIELSAKIKELRGF